MNSIKAWIKDFKLRSSHQWKMHKRHGSLMCSSFFPSFFHKQTKTNKHTHTKKKQNRELNGYVVPWLFMKCQCSQSSHLFLNRFTFIFITYNKVGANIKPWTTVYFHSVKKTQRSCGEVWECAEHCPITVQVKDRSQYITDLQLLTACHLCTINDVTQN